MKEILSFNILRNSYLDITANISLTLKESIEHQHKQHKTPVITFPLVEKKIIITSLPTLFLLSPTPCLKFSLKKLISFVTSTL